jgi:hypothetical protein
MFKFNIPLCLLCFALLSGCGDGNGFGLFKDDAARLAQLEASKQIPTLDRTETLAGIDDNNNGVRDDIESYINSLPLDSGQRIALFEKAKILNQTLLVNKNNRVLVQDIANKNGLLISCFFYKYDNNPIANLNVAQILLKIESMTSNTKIRLREYLLYNKSLDGTTSSLVEGLEACRQLGL